MIDEAVSKKIHVLKVLAILSVICAHCNMVNEDAGFMNKFTHFFLNAFGTIGVGVFFFVSGYLFNCFTNRKEGLLSFVVKKIERLILPWLFCGTFVWLYVVLRKGGITLENWSLFMIGKGSYLYFIPVLFFLYLLFWFVNENAILLFGGILLSIISNLLTYMQILPSDYAVLNIFNWLIFFAGGIVICKYGWKVYSIVKWMSLLIICICLGLISFKSIYLTYWTPGFLLFELIGGVGLYKIAEILAQHETEKTRNRMSRYGNWTMAIYLLHMPIAGIVANICATYDWAVLTLVRPLIVLLITLAALEIYYIVAYKWLKKIWLIKIIGLR